MGSTCIVGVDDNQVLKDFVRAHVEYLSGDKILVGETGWEFSHDGRTLRHFYTRRPVRRKLKSLLPATVYRRVAQRHDESDAQLADSFAAFFEKHDVDVILAEFGTTGARVYRHARAAGIPLVVHFHGHDAHRSSIVEKHRAQYREMFDYAWRIISVSRFMSDTLAELGADPSKIVLNPYGPRDRFFANAPDYRQTVLSVGRFTDIKASYLVLMAFRDALDAAPDARLVMAGEGELLETCRTLAKVWGIADRVSFPGAVKHAGVDSLFRSACCFVQHSVTPSYGDAEGTPVAILEAGAAALPVIATRHAGISDAVVHDVTGFLVDELDVRGMAACIRRCLADSELCRTMGAAAREHIRRDYSMSRHIQVLQEAIDGARASA